jgi:hypothetical protein
MAIETGQQVPTLARFARSCGMTVLLMACVAPSDSRRDTATRAAVVQPAPSAPTDLVDTTLGKAVAGQGGWNYQQTASADLDGDGQIEKVVLTARVELLHGRPAWDDGQPWQAYIEEPDGTRTYVFARFVQLGTLALRLSAPESNEHPHVVLLEQLPDRLSVYEVEYLGPRPRTGDRAVRAGPRHPRRRLEPGAPLTLA